METRYLVKHFEIFPRKSEIVENNQMDKYISVWNRSPFKVINVTWELLDILFKHHWHWSSWCTHGRHIVSLPISQIKAERSYKHLLIQYGHPWEKRRKDALSGSQAPVWCNYTEEQIWNDIIYLVTTCELNTFIWMQDLFWSKNMRFQFMNGERFFRWFSAVEFQRKYESIP